LDPQSEGPTPTRKPEYKKSILPNEGLPQNGKDRLLRIALFYAISLRDSNLPHPILIPVQVYTIIAKYHVVLPGFLAANRIDRQRTAKLGNDTLQGGTDKPGGVLQ
jgi:hypothetical protein